VRPSISTLHPSAPSGSPAPPRPTATSRSTRREAGPSHTGPAVTPSRANRIPRLTPASFALHLDPRHVPSVC
jgi:hypothetical protein